MLQDFVDTPPLREALRVKDGKAWILPVGLVGRLGLAGGQRCVHRVADIVKKHGRGNSADG